MGSGGFLLLYVAAGIFGNVLGGNFALVAAPSVGASGAIFGTVAVIFKAKCIENIFLIGDSCRLLGSIYSRTGSISTGQFGRCDLFYRSIM